MHKILVIEDETLVRENITELLEAEDFEVVTAENGRIGIQMAQQAQPDVIICDVMMPEIDGYGVLTALRQNPATAIIPFIFLTAKAAKADFRQGMELGADDYITKPFTRAEILAAIATRLNKRAAITEHYNSATPEVPPNQAEIAHSQAADELSQALERKEFLLYYQPQVNLRTGKIVGAEALLRWQHPQKGFISPAEFIPLAETTGMIIPIGEWVLRTACQQTQQWNQNDSTQLRISVNLSARQFNQANLSTQIIEILRETGLESGRLELEITESIVMQNVTAAIATLKELQSLGISIAIDDFGTGYSSLNYLKQFPFNTLKIDRCFVQNLDTDQTNSAITTAVIAMAQSLNLEVIAEGVETEAELQFLIEHRCQGIQGYLFSPPVPAIKFEEMLKNGKQLLLEANS